MDWCSSLGESTENSLIYYAAHKLHFPRQQNIFIFSQRQKLAPFLGELIRWSLDDLEWHLCWFGVDILLQLWIEKKSENGFRVKESLLARGVWNRSPRRCTTDQSTDCFFTKALLNPDWHKTPMMLRMKWTIWETQISPLAPSTETQQPSQTGQKHVKFCAKTRKCGSLWGWGDLWESVAGRFVWNSFLFFMKSQPQRKLGKRSTTSEGWMSLQRKKRGNDPTTKAETAENMMWPAYMCRSTNREKRSFSHCKMLIKLQIHFTTRESTQEFEDCVSQLSWSAQNLHENEAICVYTGKDCN